MNRGLIIPSVSTAGSANVLRDRISRTTLTVCVLWYGIDLTGQWSEYVSMDDWNLHTPWDDSVLYIVGRRRSPKTPYLFQIGYISQKNNKRGQYSPVWLTGVHDGGRLRCDMLKRPEAPEPIKTKLFIFPSVNHNNPWVIVIWLPGSPLPRARGWWPQSDDAPLVNKLRTDIYESCFSLFSVYISLYSRTIITARPNFIICMSIEAVQCKEAPFKYLVPAMQTALNRWTASDKCLYKHAAVTRGCSVLMRLPISVMTVWPCYHDSSFLLVRKSAHDVITFTICEVRSSSAQHDFLMSIFRRSRNWRSRNDM